MVQAKSDAWLDSCSVSEGDEEPDLLDGEGIEDGTLARGRSVSCVTRNALSSGTASKGDVRKKALRLRQQVGLPASVSNARVVSAKDAFNSCKGTVESSGCDPELETKNKEENSSNGDENLCGLQSTDGSEGLGVDTDEGFEDSISEGNDTLENDDVGTFPLVSAELLEEQQRLEEDAEAEQEMVKKRDKETEARLRKTAAQTKNQMALWAGLLTARIQFQGIVSSSSRLSETEGADTGEGLEARAAAAADVARVLLALRHLQQKLVANRPELKAAARIDAISTLVSDEDDIEEDMALELSACGEGASFLGDRKRRRIERVKGDPLCRAENRVWQQIDVWPRKLKQWSLSVVDHWHAEVNATAQKHFKVLDQSPSAQLERVMQTDAERLLETSYRVGSASGKLQESGATDAEKYRSYQDTEFYAMLLRDALTATKGGEYGETQGTFALLEGSGANGFLQRLKARDEEKRKKEVERRASKGRKIRYVPIPKLVHFMTPRPLALPTFYGGRLENSGESPEQEAYISQFIASLFQHA